MNRRADNSVVNNNSMEEFFYKKLYTVIIAQHGRICQENSCGFFMFFMWIVQRMNQTENILESIGSGYFSNRKVNLC